MLLRGGVVGVADLRLEKVGEPGRLAVDEVEAVAVHRAVGEVVEDIDGAERIPLADAAAVSLLEVGRGPGHVDVVQHAGAHLQVDALVDDGVTDQHVQERRRGLVRGTGAGAGRGGLAAEPVKLAGDADAVGGRRRLAVQDGDAVARDAVLHQRLADPLVGRGRLAEDHVAAVRAGGDATRALDELRGLVVVRPRQRPLDDHVSVLVGVAADRPTARLPHADLILGDRSLRGATGQRRLVGVALVELGVQRDQREPGEQAEDAIAGASVRIGVLEHVLDLGDVGAVLVLLRVVHDDGDDLRDRMRERHIRVPGGEERALAVDEHAQVGEVLEADDGRLLGDVEGGVEHVAPLDPQEAVDELLGVVDAAAGEQRRVDELQDVVELERAVLRGGRGEQDDAGAAGPFANGGGAKVELPRAVAALAARTHELGHAVLARLRHVEVLERGRLVDDEHVDADFVPDDAGVVGLALRELEGLRDPGGEAVLEQGLVALAELVGVLVAEVTLAQVDRSPHCLDRIDVLDDGLLADLRAAERVEAEDHDIGLAALERDPLGGPLVAAVGLGGDEALALAAGEALALRADYEDPVVGERAEDVVVPLPHQRARHEDHRTTDPAHLARVGEDQQGGVGLADADVEGEQTAEEREDPACTSDLVRARLGCVDAPANDVEGLG